MANIGNFTASKDGFVGTVRTLALNAEVKIVLSERKGKGSPDYRIVAGTIEIGAAWKRIGRDSKRPYLSVVLDDPSFPTAIRRAD